MKPAKSIILLVNLGSPTTLSVSAIANFLRKFLSDKRVVGLSKLIWYPLLYGIILPFRSRRLLDSYASIWHNNKSPLIYYTQLQSALLLELLPDNTLADYAFSYTSPEIHKKLYDLHLRYEIKQLTVIPLYPQFSSTTTSAVFDQISTFYADKKYLPTIRFIRGFAKDNLYIKAVAAKIIQSWQEHGRAEKLVFSYHSLPQSIVDSGDCYYDECLATTQCLVNLLGLDKADYVIAFQSKVGHQKWLVPSTLQILKDLAKQNTGSVDIVCPGFVSDCLETLEEIAIINKQVFLNNGGKQYNYIACLNESPEFIEMLYSLALNSEL